MSSVIPLNHQTDLRSGTTDTSRGLSAEQVIDRVVPSGGWVVIATKKAGGQMRHKFCTNAKAAADYACQQANNGFDVYHGCASYRADTNRRQENVRALKCFWLDADVKRDGDGKAEGIVYPDAPTAVRYIGEFCAAASIPRPNLGVNSGYGLHAYWVLEDAIAPETWQPLADALRGAFERNGILGDTGVTTDSARILRPPETLNFKVPAAPKPVTTLWNMPEIANRLMVDALAPFMASGAAADDPLSADTGFAVKSERRTTVVATRADATQIGPLPGTRPAVLAKRRASTALANARTVPSTWLGEIKAAAEHVQITADYFDWRDNWLFPMASAIQYAPQYESALYAIFDQINRRTAPAIADETYFEHAHKLLDAAVAAQRRRP